ncbi:hypothetical protein LUX12_07665 [Streptomyces somaliensis]|uniref:hypothetical protein n=1 Tax=Streptomyces somaliensis TaxID=78355 RepID=UPI0020CFE16D|nr:hypothetical protein [Streptomyces somaliensis]MCP9944682.1 hypothetical protein [Streptomyces somaliensis]MCP9962097.1 hypothetical protein [Streptomyces somaliensis]MCP9974911.1 hypothetical protein [Streptomyces somaliensis]
MTVWVAFAVTVWAAFVRPVSTRPVFVRPVFVRAGAVTAVTNGRTGAAVPEHPGPPAGHVRAGVTPSRRAPSAAPGALRGAAGTTPEAAAVAFAEAAEPARP